MRKTETKGARRGNRRSVSEIIGKPMTRALRARDGHCCAYCSATVETSGAPLQFDHLTCASRDGGLAPTNLITACRRCNSARQAMTLAQFAAYASVVYGLTFTARGIRAQARRRLPAA